jgi:hypothetical protein
MKTKICALCKKEDTVMYRVKIIKEKHGFLFVKLVVRLHKNYLIMYMAAIGKDIGIKKN